MFRDILVEGESVAATGTAAARISKRLPIIKEANRVREPPSLLIATNGKESN